MNLALDEVVKELQTGWQAFAVDQLSPLSERIDHTGEIPEEILTIARERRLLAPFLPQSLGGQGCGLLEAALLMEELGRFSPAFAVLAAQQIVLGIRATLRCSNVPDPDDLARKAADFSVLFSFAATETASGSDLSALSTRCRRQGEQFVLHGGKAQVNWANRRGYLFLLARPEEDEGTGSSLFLVPTAKFHPGTVHPTLGMCGLEAAPIEIDTVEVSPEHLAGVYGYGFDQYDLLMNEMRIAVAAIATGIGEQAYKEAAQHAKTRKQFGQPVGSFQSLQWRFADMATLVEASRLHVWQAVEKAQEKHSCFTQAAMAKIFATEGAFTVANFAVQVLAGKAYIKPNRVEQLFRDSRFLLIGWGTSEILRNKIAEQLG